MKKRIIALILVVVMSLLTFAGCAKSVDFVEDITSYAKFKDGVDFISALQNLVIKDGAFTNSEADRVKKISTQIYNSVLTGMLAANPDHKTEGKLDGGDVLYFVYYAQEAETEENKDKDRKIFYYSNMNEATAENTGHVFKLGDVDENNKFMKALSEALTAKNEAGEYNIADFIYNMNTKTEISEEVTVEATKTATDDCTANHTHEATDDMTAEQVKEKCIKDAVDAAVKEDLTVKAGGTYVISYTRTEKIQENPDDPVSYDVRTAKYEQVTLNTEDLFFKHILESGVQIDGGAAKNATTGTNEFEVGNYVYSNVKILWEVVEPKEAFLEFTYNPFSATAAIAPDSLHTSKDGTTTAATIKPEDELTYYVYPVYYIDVDAPKEIDGADILTYVVGSKIKADYFDAFDGAVYKAEGQDDKAVSALVADILKIFDTTNADIYAEGSNIKALLTAYNDAAAAAGTSTSGAKYEAKVDAAAALLKEQLALVNPIAEKINAATTNEDGESAIYNEYYEGIEHELVEKYNATIVENVQEAVWKLIQDSVEVTNYPEKAVKEYYNLIYNDYEYDYYKGSTNGVKNVDAYANLTAYLTATLKVDAKDIEAAITDEAKAMLKPVIQLYFVANAVKADAVAKMAGYIESDILAGAYETEEDKEAARKDAKLFYVDNNYMKDYKKEVGRRFYNDVIEQYGEINVRASFQFNKLFYYLTSTELVSNTEDGHAHTEAKAVLTDGTWTIQFRNVKYTVDGVESSK